MNNLVEIVNLTKKYGANVAVNKFIFKQLHNV